jgi:SAM-dependent methyltransferase
MLMRGRRARRSELRPREGQAAIAVDNRGVFERPDVVEDYIRDTALRAAERVILDRHRADYVGKRVLDLGVGAGRTAPSLAPNAARYVGVDFSERMVAACRMRFPEWDFQWGDARDLAVFGTGSFDFVLFFFNGLDYVGDEDRQRVLAEVLRVLDRGGVFAFSSHNLEASAGATWRWRVVLRPRPPAELARALRRAGRSIRNRLRNAGRQIRTDRYAILNDPAHQFGLQTYYIGAAAQIDQLRRAGFTGPVDVLGDDGLPLLSSTSREFLYYVVRKAF